MLYATTRSDLDTFSAQRALKEPCAPDGGLYVPTELSKLSRKELDVLLQQSEAAILAEILNSFFSTRLSAKDVEFILGKQLFRLEHMSHRITAAECWRNPDGDISRIERLLARCLAVEKGETPAGEWLRVVCRIGVLFCVYRQMCLDQSIHWYDPMDIAVVNGDFTTPMAAWTAREMGLPIGNIICCCNENAAVWDLFQQGEIRTAMTVIQTMTPRCDIGCPSGLERLIYFRLGLEESRKFADARMQGKTYLIGNELEKPFPGMHASVIHDRRIPGTIANVHSTNGYILSPYHTLLYAGLMDYRSNTGCSGQALLLCERSPMQCADAIAYALGITTEQLAERLDRI